MNDKNHDPAVCSGGSFKYIDAIGPIVSPGWDEGEWEIDMEFTIVLRCVSTDGTTVSGSVPAPGQFQLLATGTAGLTYTLQSSTNLVHWEARTNLLADPDGVIECLMNMGPNAPACFYRLRWP